MAVAWEEGEISDKFDKKNSERPVDALAVKNINDSLTHNLKSRDASASKKRMIWGFSGVIWGDLGTFWSDLNDFKMQNHSVMKRVVKFVNV